MPDDLLDIPADLGPAGRDFYASAVEDYDLSIPERTALYQAAQTLDIVDALEAGIREHGRVLANGKPNPLLLEVRQQRAILVRLLGLLDLRLDSDGAPADGAGGESATSRAARAAARKRWDKLSGR